MGTLVKAYFEIEAYVVLGGCKRVSHGVHMPEGHALTKPWLQELGAAAEDVMTEATAWSAGVSSVGVA